MPLITAPFFESSPADDLDLQKSYKLRYPQKFLGCQTSCHLCLVDDVEKDAVSVFERLTCQGDACLSAATGSGKGAVTWLCERCALHLDVRQQAKDKRMKQDRRSKLADVQRNMTCQCEWGTPALIDTFMVKKTAEGDALIALDRSTQIGVVVDGTKLFTEMPSMAALVHNPDAYVEHLMACRKMGPDNKPMTATTFNTALANTHNNEEGKRVSVQIVPDTVLFEAPSGDAMEDDDLEGKPTLGCVDVICSAPVTSTKVKPVAVKGSVVHRGANRSVRSKGATRGNIGTSSKLAQPFETAQPTGNTIRMRFAFPDEERSGIAAELVFDGILPPGSSKGLMLRLLEPQTTKPSFCPITTILEIKTQVSATLPADASKREIFHEIVTTYKLDYAIVDDFYVVRNIDTGESTVFTNIANALVLCGFGARADHFDWHMVVLRRGRHFLTLYILVVHAPFPGIWIIAERLSLGKTVEDSTVMSIMVGQDVAPHSLTVTDKITIERGLWTEDMMCMFLGFSEKSFALENCLNMRMEDLSGPLHKLGQAAILDIKDVEQGFQATKRCKILLNAIEEEGINNQFVARYVAEHAEEQKAKGLPATALFPGNVLNAGPHGMFRVVIRTGEQYSDRAEKMVVTNLIVKAEEGAAAPEIHAKIELQEDELIFIELIHFRGLDLGNEIKHDQDLDAIYVDVNEDETHCGTVSYSVGDWTNDSISPFLLDDNEDYCDWILRNASTQQTLFKIHFEKYTAPPVNIVADGFPFTDPVLVPLIHSNVAPIPVLHPGDAFRKVQAANGIFVHVGEYGWIRVVISQYKDETRSEHEGELLADVTLHKQGSIPEIRGNVATDIQIRFALEQIHDGIAADMADLDCISIWQNHGERDMFLARHHMLARTYVTQDGVCQFDMDESACKVELRHRATKQVVLRMVFDHRTN